MAVNTMEVTHIRFSKNKHDMHPEFVKLTQVDYPS